MKSRHTLITIAVLSCVFVGVWRATLNQKSQKSKSTAALRDDSPTRVARGASMTNSESTTRSSSATGVDVNPLPQVIGSTGDNRLSTRLSALERLGTRMKHGEIVGLYGYLRNGCKSDNSLNSEQLYVFANEVLDALQKQDNPPPGLTEILISVFHDHAQPEVVRDYVVQHMGSWYAYAPDKAPIRQALWEATSETHSAIAGTALLALSSVAERTSGDVDLDLLREKAIQLSADEKCNVGTRTTALQVCAELGVTEIKPIAQELARSAQVISLRISAIAALGVVGGVDSVTFLKEQASGSDTRVQPAARIALKRLQRRLQG